MQYVKRSVLSMKSHPELNEKWLQAQIVEHPEMLGFGEVTVHNVEKSLPGGGRLDLLLSDPENNTRYELELQLGQTDESHIIRTIEYWDLERRRYPQYDHVAVIIAEEITARFFNVIGLFNGFIPLVAINVSAIQVAPEEVTLVFTRVLDHRTLAPEEDEPGVVTDRAYWEGRSTEACMGLYEELLAIAKKVDPTVAPNFNRPYIGLARNGVATNFVVFRPRKKTVNLDIKLARTDEIDQIMADAPFETLAYATRWGNYRPVIPLGELDECRDLLEDLFRRAYDQYHG